MKVTLPGPEGYAALWRSVGAFLDNVRPPRPANLQTRQGTRMNSDLLIDKPPSGVVSVETTVTLKGLGQQTVTHAAPFASDATGNKVVLPNVVGGLAPGDEWSVAAVSATVTGLKSDPATATFTYDVKPDPPTGLEAVYHD